MKNDKAKGENEKKKTARKCHAIQYLTNATSFITLSVTHQNLHSPFNLFICWIIIIKKKISMWLIKSVSFDGNMWQRVLPNVLPSRWWGYKYIYIYIYYRGHDIFIEMPLVKSLNFYKWLFETIWELLLSNYTRTHHLIKGRAQTPSIWNMVDFNEALIK